MGSLQYDGVLIQFDDRVLAHLHIVIIQKLRRGESFSMSWKDAMEVGSGRSSVWIHPTQNLYFKFIGGRPPAINQEWVDRLMESANSSRGLVVTSEPDLVSEEGAVAHETHLVEVETLQRATISTVTAAKAV